MIRRVIHMILLLFATICIACSATEVNNAGDNIDADIGDTSINDETPMSEESEETTDTEEDTGNEESEETNEEGTDDGDSGEEEENYPVGSSKNLNVLFVGNSLTYYNDLPQLVKKEADAKSITMKTTMLAYPNYAIIDHWDDGEVQKLVAENEYDFVIIQQGPSSQAFGRDVLLNYGKRFKDLCNNYNSKLVFYMVWPSIGNFHTFDDVIKNHRDAAEANNALLSPVGEVWKQDIEFTGDYSYYGEDNFHPSLLGSKVAAKVIGKTIFNN